MSKKEKAVLREDPAVGPILIGMDHLTGDQRKHIVTSVFGDRKSEDVAAEMEEELRLICDWNVRTEPPPSHQLHHSTPKPGKGMNVMQKQHLEEQLAQGRRHQVKEGPIIHCAPDLDQLEATFASPAPYQLSIPKFHTFSGDLKVKADVDYETWRHEVMLAAEGNMQEAIREAMLQSLKGKAADMAWFSASYNVAETLAVLDATFGNVAPAPVLMKELHSESWIQGEAMSDYRTRLMDQMQRIHQLYPKEISEEETPTLLRDHFY